MCDVHVIADLTAYQLHHHFNIYMHPYDKMYTLFFVNLTINITLNQHLYMYVMINMTKLMD